MHSLARQKQLLQRGLIDVLAHLERVFQSPTIERYKALSRSNMEFKRFVEEHITIPSIREYIVLVPEVEERPRKRSFLERTFPWAFDSTSIFEQKRDNLFQDLYAWSRDLKGHYLNLKDLTMAIPEEETKGE